MNKKITAAVLLVLSLTACGNKQEEALIEDVAPVAETQSVSDFVYHDENSKAYIVFNGNSSSKTDITDYVTNYSKHSLFINKKGMEKIFGLKVSTITQEDIEKFDQEEEIMDLHSAPTGEYIKFVSDTRSFVFKEGSKLYLCDGTAEMMPSVVIVQDDGDYSIPMNNLIFDFGYTSLGTSIEGDAIIYSLNSTGTGTAPIDNIDYTYKGELPTEEGSEDGSEEGEEGEDGDEVSGESEETVNTDENNLEEETEEETVAVETEPETEPETEQETTAFIEVPETESAEPMTIPETVPETEEEQEVEFETDYTDYEEESGTQFSEPGLSFNTSLG